MLRPHGHLLRTGDVLSPDTDGLTSTVWMDGTFASQVTRGHVGRDPLLTGRRSYLGLHRAHGARVLVERTTAPATVVGCSGRRRPGASASTAARGSTPPTTSSSR